MRVGAAALAGGLFGGVGTLFFLLAFGTDYWLVASDDCGGPTTVQVVVPIQDGTNGTEGMKKVVPSLSLHHEGFFLRCEFQSDPSVHAAWAVIFTNQPETKLCIRGYLFPLPVTTGPVPHPSYDPTAALDKSPGWWSEDYASLGRRKLKDSTMFRGFWTVLILLGVFCGLFGVFMLLVAVSFSNPAMHRRGGIFLCSAACLFLVLVVLYVLWMELVDVRRYVLQERGEACPRAQVTVLYGWSFMLAAAGIPLELISGLLFVLVGRALHCR